MPLTPVNNPLDYVCRQCAADRGERCYGRALTRLETPHHARVMQAQRAWEKKNLKRRVP